MSSEPILTSYFGNILGGRMPRGAFTWRLLSLIVLLVVLSVGLGLTGGIDRYAALFIPVSFLILFASLNIIAKRFRDIGLPGWMLTAAALATGVLISVAVPGPFEVYFVLLLGIVLILFPRVRTHKSA